jgi:hypothetical protein
MTLHFCTVFDRNYLHKGLSLYFSLHEELKGKVGIERPFMLHVLCLDQETFETLRAINYKNVYLYLLSNLEEYYPELQQAKQLQPSLYGSQRDNYIWRLTPFFVNHLLSSNWIKPHQYLMYVDSDIFFYKSPEVVLNVIKESKKSVGIHTHRFGGPFKNTMDVGWFNVGVIVFKADAIGKRIAGWWKTLTINNNHDRYKEYGTCGDQKYLDLIYQIEKDNVCVFDEEGSLYHLAPWNDYIADKDDELVFMHFSHFQADLQGMNHKDSYHGEWNPMRNPNVKNIYDTYNQHVQMVDALIQKATNETAV